MSQTLKILLINGPNLNLLGRREPGHYGHQTLTTIVDELSKNAALAGVPFIEVHLSNVHAREPFRHHSYFSDKAQGVICGLGAQGYEFALQAAIKHLNDQH